MCRDARRRLSAVAVILLMLAAVAYAGEIGVGDSLPSVTLSGWEAGTVRLDEQRGRVVIVDFWASWCQPCREALPALDALARRYAGDGLVVFAVSIDDSAAVANRFVVQHLPHATLTLLRDPGGAALARFGAAGMPALYLCDRTGRVRLVKTGYAPAELQAVERHVVELLHATHE